MMKRGAVVVKNTTNAKKAIDSTIEPTDAQEDNDQKQADDNGGNDKQVMIKNGNDSSEHDDEQ